MDRERLTYKGFCFACEEDVEIAKNEAKKIDYLEAHLDRKNIAMLHTVYDKALENRSFSTPLGLSYLQGIRNDIIASGVDDIDIEPIPLYTTYRRISLDDPKFTKRRMTKTERKELSLRLKYRNSCIVIAILAFLIVVMFVITLNGNTPNIINYKTAITNQYASWEQELTERENAVREKERELNISK